MLRLFCLFFISLILYPAFSQTSGTFTDNRDGNIYRFVIIGDQTWMADNLNYNSPDSWCYDDSINNCDNYGRLYTWEAAMKACPDNWHLPSDKEWKLLEQSVGMTIEEVDIFLYRGEGKGTKLKSKNEWGGQNPEYNTAGFNALPAGFRLSPNGSFLGKGKDARWWTSSTEIWKGTTYAFRRCIFYDHTGIDRDAATLTLGFSVRCIKNQP